MEKIVVYFLQHKQQSYIGYTVNLARRMKQHRQLIKGGARATRRWQGDFQLVAIVSGFPTKCLAMSFEWQAKRRYGPVVCPLPSSLARLPRFFQPLLMEKFKTLDLEIVLFYEHQLVEALRQYYHNSIKVDLF